MHVYFYILLVIASNNMEQVLIVSITVGISLIVICIVVISITAIAASARRFGLCKGYKENVTKAVQGICVYIILIYSLSTISEA